MPVTTKFTSKSINNNNCNGKKIPMNMGEYNHRTIVVGVKLDSESRELLTWALVKAAHPGDRVIALHVLTNNSKYYFLYYYYYNRVYNKICLYAESVDHDGKSSLLSLVKTFDSILAVYEGFCNLKQVVNSFFFL